jgi:CsoR family transcriptional regulator, copper-sensing transcriptional repressor
MPSARIRDAGQQRELVLRLKRIEGQLRGIQAMIEAGEDCDKVVQQLSASRKALDKTFFNVLACAVRAEPPKGSADPDAQVRHAAELLAKFG